MYPPIGSREDLDALLTTYARSVVELSTAGDDAQAERLAVHLERLSTRAALGGIVADEWSGCKFMTTDPRARLVGGGNAMTSASKVDEYEELRKNCHAKSRSVVQASLEAYAKARAVDRTSAVIIENESNYSLELVAHGSSCGYFFSDIYDAFGAKEDDKRFTLKPGFIGGFLHSKNSNAWFGSVGYVSFRLAVEGRSYIVIIGFSTVHSGTNRAGIEIRVEDGIADENGNIPVDGHAVLPAAAISDVDGLMQQSHSVQNNKYHVFSSTGASSRCAASSRTRIRRSSSSQSPTETTQGYGH
ncbi:hypothetical protein PINS_up016514 [Pythium insidiosum]|nr:hypothetical protein PINS_up016514 [Pythium insidiosum]